jgi:EmrB/QacA subfamily drug resistance transporter
MNSKLKWSLLAVLALAQFMVVLDSSIVNVALPAIQQALNISSGDLAWLVTAYTLAFGGFLLFGGRAADLYGRRKMFLIGVVGFTLSSLIVGVAQDTMTVIIGRGLQGLAAALMSPAALSIVLTTFREGKERNAALGIWAAVAAGGAAVGVLLGGILTQYLNWRWNFFINLPLGIFVIIAALKLVPAHAKEVAHNDLDLPGAVLVTGGLMSLVYAIEQAPDWGWTEASTLGLFGLSLAMLVGFVVNEARAKHPLMPLSIFRIRNISAANLVQMPITAAMFSMFFFISIYIQTVMGFSPVETGLSFLPVTIIIAITATLISRAVVKIGFKPILVTAPTLMAAGLFWLSQISLNSSYWADIFPGLALVAIGAGMSFVALTIAATSGVPANESGLASGLLNTAQQIGGALGLAILSGIAASHATSYFANHATDANVMASASVEGYQMALLVGTFFAIGAAILALLFIRNQKQAAGKPLPTAH